MPASGVVRENVATLVTESVSTTVPELPSSQPEKTEPGEAVAVSVRLVPAAKVAVHDVPHEMPAGALSMVPLPEPSSTTVSRGSSPRP